MTSSDGKNESDSNVDFVTESRLLDILPDELILEILSHLSLPDLALRVWPLRNRRLRRICKDPKFCTTVDVDSRWDADTAFKVVLMVRGQHLKELDLERRQKDCNLLALLALESSPNMETLKCNDEIPSDALFSALGRSDSSVRKLELFPEDAHWPTMHPYDYPCQVLVANAVNLRNLTWLKVGTGIGNDYWCFNQDLLGAIADNCKQLEHLDLMTLHGEVRDHTFNHFLDSVRRTLKHLSLGEMPRFDNEHSGLTDASFSNLRYCEILEELHLNDATDLGIEGLRAIAALPKLRKLQLYYCCFEVTGQNYTEVFGVGKIMANLTSLIMCCCKLDDVSVETIAKSCPNLEHLELTNNPDIGDHGVNSITRQCRRLICLLLTGTGVTADALVFNNSFSMGSPKYVAVNRNMKLKEGTMMKECELFQSCTCLNGGNCDMTSIWGNPNCSCGGPSRSLLQDQYIWVSLV